MKALKSGRNVQAEAPRLRRSVVMVNQALRGLRGGAVGLAAFQLLAFSPPTLALPTGGTVVTNPGDTPAAVINPVEGTTLRIDQSGAKAILNWTSFSIDGGETVNFVQPSASSIALNRVTGTSPSDIFGALTANGRVFLVNPNGILFGSGASVNVGGLVASTLDISNDDFLGATDTFTFSRNGTAGSVTNEATITLTTPSSYAALIGPQVTNEGTINVLSGSVALAAGDQVTLNMLNDSLIGVSVPTAALQAAVLNQGSLIANGGTVFLTARDADALLDTVINNSGIIRANSLVERNGVILLDGGTTGVVANSGTLQTAAGDLDTTGGSISVSGRQVSLLTGSTVTSDSGTIAITSTAGTEINGVIATGNATDNAVVVKAGNGRAAGDATGGDITIGAGSTITVGTGGRASLYTGSIVGSTGVTNLVGSGSGNFRYNSDSANQNYTLDLPSAGTVAVYREQPTLTIAADNKGPITYSDAAPDYTSSVTGFQNGDTAVQALSASATVTDDGVVSTSGNLTAGSHTLTASDAVDQLGYAIAYAPGTLTVEQLALTGSIATVGSVYGSSLSPAGEATLTNVVGADVVAPVATVVDTTGRPHSSGGKLVAGTHVGIQKVTALGGADGGNYSFANVLGDYEVDQLALADAAIASSSSTYASALLPGAVSFGNIVAGDVVTSAASVNTTDLSTSGTPVVGTYTQTASTIGGADAANYSFAGFTTATSNYSITQLALTNAAIAASNSTYASALVPGAVTFGNVVDGDLVTSAASVDTLGLSSSGKPVVGTYTQTASTIGGADSANYSFAGFTSAPNYTINQLALMGSIATVGSVYGSSLSPAGEATLTNVVGADVVAPVATVVDTTGRPHSTSDNLVAGTHVGIQKVTALGGADAGNYSFANVLGDYSVEQLALTGATIAPSSSIYASALTPGAVSFGNVVSGDVVTSAASVDTTELSTSGNPVVGTYTQTADTISGADAGNYSFASFTTLTPNYSITQLALTNAAIAASNSTYASALASGAVTFGNVVGDDLVTSTASVNTAAVSSSGNFIAGTYTQTAGPISGADAANYSFGGFTTATPNYTINQLALTNAAIAAGSSTYASTLVPGAVSFGNIVEGDLVTSAASVDTALLSTSGNPVVGTYTQTAGAISGADAANYSFAGFTTPTPNYTINQLALTVSGLAALNKVYDGNTIATVSAADAVYTGRVTGDDVTVSATGAFADKDVGVDKTVSLSSTHNGADVGNYLITDQPTSTADITRLGSVTWMGGPTGDWSVATNWRSEHGVDGAIPDKANVEDVDLNGATVAFDSSVPILDGTVQVDNVSGGALIVNSGTLDVASAVDLTNYSQAAGIMLTRGDFTSGGYTQSGGLTDVRGNLSIASSTAVTQTGGTLLVTGSSEIDAGAASISLESTGNDFGGTLTLKGTVTKVTDANKLTVVLDTGETVIIANASLSSTGDLTIGGTAGDLIAISNGGVLQWRREGTAATESDLSAASAILIAGTPSEPIDGPGSEGNALSQLVTYSNLANATGGSVDVSGELVLIADNLPRHPSSPDEPSITADSAILKIASLTPGNSVTIKLNGQLRLLADKGVFRFKAGSELPEGVTTLDTRVVQVFIGNVSITATLDELAQRAAITAAQQSALNSAAADARQSFGTDSVTQQIDMGFSGDVGIAPTMGHSVPLEGEIISTPKCVPEAKAGVECR